MGAPGVGLGIEGADALVQRSHQNYAFNQSGRDQPLAPTLMQRRRPDGTVVTDPIERLSPLLPEEEFRANMIVKPLED